MSLASIVLPASSYAIEKLITSEEQIKKATEILLNCYRFIENAPIERFPLRVHLFDQTNKDVMDLVMVHFNSQPHGYKLINSVTEFGDWFFGTVVIEIAAKT
jgi:hypothetical protein